MQTAGTWPDTPTIGVGVVIETGRMCLLYKAQGQSPRLDYTGTGC